MSVRRNKHGDLTVPADCVDDGRTKTWPNILGEGRVTKETLRYRASPGTFLRKEDSGEYGAAYPFIPSTPLCVSLDHGEKGDTVRVLHIEQADEVQIDAAAAHTQDLGVINERLSALEDARAAISRGLDMVRTQPFEGKVFVLGDLESDHFVVFRVDLIGDQYHFPSIHHFAGVWMTGRPASMPEYTHEISKDEWCAVVDRMSADLKSWTAQ